MTAPTVEARLDALEARVTALEPVKRRKGAGRKTSARVSYERLAEVLTYDPLTGVFTWLPRPGLNIPVGQAGWTDHVGIFRIRIDGKPHGAHYLAWLYVHKEWPEGRVVFVDGDKSNLRIDNLKLTN